MPAQIEQLHADDFQDCIDFINMVFSTAGGPTDFAQLLPSYYTPTEESMQCHHVIRENGRIRALVGIYPGTLLVGGIPLRVARIGAVSTHPARREQGYMQQLMNHCMQLVRRDYALSHLGGLRHRYAYFGYEVCGSVPIISLNHSCIKHGPRSTAASPVTLQEITADDHPMIPQIQALHDSQLVHAERPPETFYAHCRNWRNRLFAAFRDENLVGYAVVEGEWGAVRELVPASSALAKDIATACLKESGRRSIDIELNPAEFATVRQLAALGENVRIESGGNWQILDWCRTLEAAATVKHRQTLLPTGEMVVDIANQGRIRLSVTAQAVSVTTTEAPPDLTLTAGDAMRLFLGPLAPERTIDVATRSGVWRSWLPLPLFLPRQDHA